MAFQVFVLHVHHIVSYIQVLQVLWLILWPALGWLLGKFLNRPVDMAALIQAMHHQIENFSVQEAKCPGRGRRTRWWVYGCGSMNPIHASLLAESDNAEADRFFQSGIKSLFWVFFGVSEFSRVWVSPHECREWWTWWIWMMFDGSNGSTGLVLDGRP